MASQPAAVSLRPLIPRAGLALHSRQLQRRILPPAVRQASTTPPPPPKPRVLAKPERFNPPSHPSRLRTAPRQYPGPPLSEHERKAQKTRRYPHMMPPEGTLLHRFLTDRILHTWITLGILVTLVFTIWFQDFLHNTPYRDILPPNSMFLAHPFAFLGRYVEVYQMHVAYTSAQTAERRKQKVEDVKKRSEYRKAHGLDQEGGIGGWVAKTDAELLGPAYREGGAEAKVAVSGPESSTELAEATGGSTEGGREQTYIDFEGRTMPVRKKWFGIW